MMKRIALCLVLLFTVSHLIQAGPKKKKIDYPLRDAVECTVRGGLPNVFAKLKAGKPVTIAYLGGSITAQPGYRVKSFNWFKKQFSKSKLTQVHAAIGGTGSNLGVFRLDHDVLRHNPDLLFIEFAVNDGGASPDRIKKAFEGIIRKTWKHNPETDICFVYTLKIDNLKTLQSGKMQRSASVMEEVADYYKIPTIHMGVEVARLEKEGKLIFKAPKGKVEHVAGKDLNVGSKDAGNKDNKILFSKDGVHPYVDSGHQVYLQAIVRSMKEIEKAGKPGPHQLKAPMLADNWEKAKMLAVSDVKTSSAWKKLDPAKEQLAKRFKNRFPSMWSCNKPGETISFKFKGSKVSVYDLVGPNCGQIIVKVDDRKPRTLRRFDPYCSYHRISMLRVDDNLDPDKVHTVTLEIHPEQPDKRKILHKHRQEDFDKNPKKYDDTAWYVGGIFIIGDLEK